MNFCSSLVHTHSPDPEPQTASLCLCTNYSSYLTTADSEPAEFAKETSEHNVSVQIARYMWPMGFFCSQLVDMVFTVVQLERLSVVNRDVFVCCVLMHTAH